MIKRWLAMGDLVNIADDTDCIFAPENTVLVHASDYDALAAELAESKRYEDQNHQRIRELEAELAVLREFAGGKCTVQKVIDAMGPMSLWSKASLEKHIEQEIAKRATSETEDKLCTFCNTVHSLKGPCPPSKAETPANPRHTSLDMERAASHTPKIGDDHG